MEQNTLGIVLSFYREKYNISQKQICDGICSVVTLSRIEQGSKEIDSLMSESLLGRLGKEVTRFEIMLNDEDYQLWKMRDEIEKAVKHQNYRTAERLIETYRNITLENHHLHRQFCMFNEAKIMLAENQKAGEVSKILMEALKFTKPSFELGSGRKELYNTMEIELILMLIHLDEFHWMKKNQELELLKILNFVKTIYSERKKEDVGVKILLELIGIEQKYQNDLKIIQYAEEAIDLISQGRGIQYIAELHFIEAKAMEHFFREKEEWEEKKRQCMEECMMAYSVFDIMNQTKEKKEVFAFCEEKLGWRITE